MARNRPCPSSIRISKVLESQSSFGVSCTMPESHEDMLHDVSLELMRLSKVVSSLVTSSLVSANGCTLIRETASVVHEGNQGYPTMLGPPSSCELNSHEANQVSSTSARLSASLFSVKEGMQSKFPSETQACDELEPGSLRISGRPTLTHSTTMGMRIHRDSIRQRLELVLAGQTPEGGTNFEDLHQQAVFPDAVAMKERVREAVFTPEYHVTDFYHKTGIWQSMARSAWFEPITLCVITLNVLWAAIEMDINDEPLLIDAHPVFLIVENSFCLFFVVEWLIRFLSFRRKRDCLRDTVFILDSILAFAFALDTWLITIIASLVDLGPRGVLGNASILRMFRLVRLNRVGRLVRVVRAFPEMVIVIKGVGVAIRSVFFTLILLTMVVFAFGIAFRSISMDSAADLERRYFHSVPASMLSLLLGGVLPEYERTVRSIADVSWVMGIIFGFFMFVTTITLMNFLIGVLVESVRSVAATEREELTVKYLKTSLLDLLPHGAENDPDKRLSREDFEALLLNPKTATSMQNMGVDVVGLVEFGEVLFQDNKDVLFKDFVRLILQLRGANPTTVKDIVDLRKFFLQELGELEDHLVLVVASLMPEGDPRRQTLQQRRTHLTSSSPIDRVLRP